MLTLTEGPLLAQATLEAAAQRARAAWLAHDAQALVGQSASLVLRLPGADPSSAVGRAQAVELLRRHLLTAGERSLRVTSVQATAAGKGWVEFERRYVVLGTGDLRRETVFLGFRKAADEWVLSEVRSAP